MVEGHTIMLGVFITLLSMWTTPIKVFVGFKVSAGIGGHCLVASPFFEDTYL